MMSTSKAMANRPVVAFDVGFLLRVAGLDVVQPNSLALRHLDEGAADILRAVMAADMAPMRPSVERGYHLPGSKKIPSLKVR